MVNIVKNYYRLREFCIITPYDAQRNAIVQQLKKENLPWESVYNVDSFQGTICCSLIYVFTMPDTKLLTIASLRQATKPRT